MPCLIKVANSVARLCGLTIKVNVAFVVTRSFSGRRGTGLYQTPRDQSGPVVGLPLSRARHNQTALFLSVRGIQNGWSGGGGTVGIFHNFNR